MVVVDFARVSWLWWKKDGVFFEVKVFACSSSKTPWELSQVDITRVKKLNHLL